MVLDFMFCFTSLVLVLGHTPGPELEFAQNRECYSLAAGLSLGMIALGVSSYIIVLIIILVLNSLKKTLGVVNIIQ